jgi:hypothetical protein
MFGFRKLAHAGQRTERGGKNGKKRAIICDGTKS